MKKLFVGNLPYQANETELHNWFNQAGFSPDTVSIIRDRFSGTPRGFGFVEINNDEEADKAIASCNGQDFLGRTLVINEARPLAERPARSFGGGHSNGGRPRSGNGHPGGREGGGGRGRERRY